MSGLHRAAVCHAIRRPAARTLLALTCGALVAASAHAGVAPRGDGRSSDGVSAASGDVGGLALTGAYGGDLVDLDSAGSRTVALVGQRLSVLDTAAGAPRALAVSPPLPGEAHAVAVAPDGSVAYVALGFAGVAVVDIDPRGGTADAPAVAPIVAELPAPGFSGPSAGLPASVDVAVFGTTLFVLGAHRLALYDVTRTDRPFALSSEALVDEGYAVAAAGWGAAVVASAQLGGQSVQLFSTADRLHVLAAGSATLGASGAVQLVANERWVGVGGGTLSQLIDVADLWAPRIQPLPLRVADIDALPTAPERWVAVGRFASDPAGTPSRILWLDMRTPTVPRAIGEAVVANGVNHVAAVDASALMAVAEASDGLVRYSEGAPDTPGELARSSVAASIGAVQATAELDEAHDVVLSGAALAVVRRGDGTVVGSAADASGRWREVAVAGPWVFAGGTSTQSAFVTPIDVRAVHAPVVRAPLAVAGKQLIALLAAGDWLAAVTDSTVTLWTIDGAGLPLLRHTLAHPNAMRRRTVALTARELLLAGPDGVRALDLDDLSVARRLFDTDGGEQNVPEIAATGGPWLLVRQSNDRLSVVRMDAAPPTTRLLDGAGRAEHAVVDGDTAYVAGPGFVGTRQTAIFQTALAAVDLNTGSIGGVSPSQAIYGPLQLRRRAGVTEVSTIGRARAVLTWRPGDAPPPPAPPPTTTRPVPTSAHPSDGRTLFMPYAAVTRPSAKPPLAVRQVLQLGGHTDSVTVDGSVAWLRGRGTLTAVDIDSIPPRALGSVTVCEPDACNDNRFAASGGRVALDDGADGVTFVDASDPRRPRVGGRFASTAFAERGFEVIAPWPGRPLFLIASTVRDAVGVFDAMATDLTIVDATRVDEPRVVRTTRRPEHVLRLIEGDGLVYFMGVNAVDQRLVGELQVWRIAPTGELDVVGRLPIDDDELLTSLADEGTSFVQAGKRLIVAQRYQVGLHVIDIGDPAHPRAVEAPDIRAAFDSADLVFEPTEYHSLHAMDGRLIMVFPRGRSVIAVPLEPGEAPAERIDMPTSHLRDDFGGVNSQTMASAGDRLLVAGGVFGGLSVVRGIRSGSPSVATLASVGAARGVSAVPGAPQALLVSGGAVDILHRADLTTPSDVESSDSAIGDPGKRPFSDWDGTSGVELAVDGTAAWVAEAREGLAGFEIGAAGAVRAMPSSADGGESFNDNRLAIAVVDEGRFALTAAASRGLESWDAGTRSGPPQRVVRLGTGGAPEDVAVAGTHAFVADGPGGLLVLDVRNIAAPRDLARLRLPGSAVRLALDVHRGLVWVGLERRSNSLAPLSGIAGGREATVLVAVDVTDVTSPRLRGVLGLGAEWIRDIVLADDLVVVSGASVWDGDRPFAPNVDQQALAVFVVDADPTAPALRGQWTDRTSSDAAGGLAALSDGRVALATGEDGVRVLRIDAGGR